MSIHNFASLASDSFVSPSDVLSINLQHLAICVAPNPISEQLLVRDGILLTSFPHHTRICALRVTKCPKPQSAAFRCLFALETP